MRVIEIFDSIDGEGIRTGLPVTFIRLAGCNLRCSYCDTLYSLYGEEEPCEYMEMTVEEILERINPLYRRVTLTGGEPLIHENCQKLVQSLLNENYEVNIETNGAVDITAFSSGLQGKEKLFYTIDYKLSSSGMQDKMIWENFLNLRSCDVVKLVVGSEQDLEEAIRITAKLREIYPEEQPHIFMGAVYGSFAYQDLVEEMLSNPVLKDVRFQIQLHKVIWDPDLRGV